MDLFGRYEGDFLELSQAISDRIARVPSLQGDAKRQEIEEAESEIADAEATLQSLNLQAKNVPVSERPTAQATVRKHQQELREQKRLLKNAEIAFTTARTREALFDTGTELQLTSMDQRSRMVRATDQSAENKERLLQSRQTLEETLGVAEDIIEELIEQRSRMERMRDTLRGINDKVTVAGAIVGRMTKRIFTNKLIVLLIIFVLLAVIGVVIYLRFFYHLGS
eukprot:TRINITY_DN4081_c0_g1_i1.p1 TRINITY_DN4081_c0_g1~~TRINITY_DN4081_c0_g1_i1.p1  ORF type:complete len:224 (+),score=38.21 TRINITY_DN4081_c0_g1_i1:42-713(+)